MKKIIQTLVAIVVMSGVLLFAGFFFVLNAFFANESEKPSPEPVTTVEQFIDTIGETARELGQANDIYASVMIAQAMLESNKGTSGLASEPNFNLFGIKGSYQNQSVAFETFEDDGQGNMKKVMANFRKYPSYEASLKDYVDLVRNGVSWDAGYYEATFKSNTTSYQDATAYLTGTYATDSSYHVKLNQLIEQYNLEQFDK